MEFIDIIKDVANEVYTCYDNNEWDKAESILLDNLKLFPNEWWILTCLSQVNKSKRNYKIAYDYAKQAFEINSEDHICIYEYAESLLRNDETEKAISLLRKILRKGLNKIAYGRYGDGLMLGKSKINDSVALLGYAYFDLKDNKKARYYFRRHLKNRRRGIYSNFTKKQIEKALEKCEW